MQIYAVSLSGALPEQHSHEDDEILFCRVGGGTVQCGGREMNLRAGDILCIPPGTVHSVLPAEQILETLCPQSAEPPLRALLQLKDFDGSFATLFELACAAQKREGAYWAVYVNGICGAMYRLLQCWDEEFGVTQHRVALLLQQILRTQGLDPEFDLQAAIRSTGYSAGYVRHIFKAAVGCSPQQFLSRYRIGYAKAQMRAFRGELSIKELSRRSGFRDPYYFSRVFREQEGVSPRTYLRRLG